MIWFCFVLFAFLSAPGYPVSWYHFLKDTFLLLWSIWLFCFIACGIICYLLKHILFSFCGWTHSALLRAHSLLALCPVITFDEAIGTICSAGDQSWFSCLQGKYYLFNPCSKIWCQGTWFFNFLLFSHSYLAIRGLWFFSMCFSFWFTWSASLKNIIGILILLTVKSVDYFRQHSHLNLNSSSS